MSVQADEVPDIQGIHPNEVHAVDENLSFNAYVYKKSGQTLQGSFSAVFLTFFHVFFLSVATSQTSGELTEYSGIQNGIFLVFLELLSEVRRAVRKPRVINTDLGHPRLRPW